MSFSNLPTKLKILIGSAPSLVLLVVLGVTTILILDSVLTTSRWVYHTEEVIADANQIVGEAVNMETGLRGFLLAGRDAFLAPYRAGEKAAYDRIGSLQETVSDNPVQVERLGEAEQVLREWQSEVAAPAIELRRAIGDSETMNDMATLVQEERGKVYFDRFRAQIATFIQREEALLGQRRDAFQTAQAEVIETLEMFQESAKWVEHTQAVLTDAAKVSARAVDIEAGLRGFLLTGDDAFLARYRSDQEAVFAETARLRETVNDNPPQVGRLRRVESSLRDWLEQVAEPAIALRREVDRGVRTMADVDAFVSNNAGNKNLDAVRAEIGRFMQVETDLLGERRQAVEDAHAETDAMLATMAENEAWVTHTYGVIDQAKTILAKAVDMETGMRGFLLAGRDTFLEPYTSGKERFVTLVTELQRTVLRQSRPGQAAG